ncbi:hypothetical protein Tco_1191327 [Tanacetum coccineum]
MHEKCVLPCTDHPPSGILEQLSWSLVRKTQVVAADRLWEHIPTVGLTVVENKRCGERWIDTHLLDKYLKEVLKTVGEGVDEIDKLVELTNEMQLKQVDQGCVHASNEHQLHVVHVVADEHEVDQRW